MIKAAQSQQLFVRAALDDALVVDDQHLVGIADCAESMGDDKSCPPFQQAQQRLLNTNLGAGIDAARRFIQDEDARVGQDGAGNRQQLPLPLAEVMPFFRYLRLNSRAARDE